ncbi:hypothetical protein CBR_g4873 [Chara braunii]|uniref:Uncharacterized protein n=1 Tax=Chara braunii TaxID=69332 RepID=A0A388KJ06_CHABU|nr:hypothetical protein CBR_g4873 [Chara braunii]|eukprot:GBG70045.1 hypothetical protein CBR_g4873 [Chara braunii]
MCEADRAQKEAKIKKKAEKKEAERRAREEKEAKERKARKKAEKARAEKERIATMRKDMDIHVKSTVKAAMQAACSDFREVLEAAKLHETKTEKQRVTYASEGEGFSEYKFVSSETEEIRERTKGLIIHEKRKRGPESTFEDSPLIELPTKQTPRKTPKRGVHKMEKLTPRVTRSTAKTKVRLSPATKEKLASALKRKIPVACGLIGRYKFRDAIISQLKIMDAITLQNLCNDEGIPYNGKIDAIFDLAEHRTYIAYGTEEEEGNEAEEKQEEEEGYVCFHLSTICNDQPLLRNAKNVPIQEVSNRIVSLQQEVELGFCKWANGRGKPVSVKRKELERCFAPRNGDGAKLLTMGEALQLKRDLEGLVCTHLDRNPGETLVLCLKVYFDAMMSTSVMNHGYIVVKDTEEQVLREMRDDMDAMGLKRMVRWDVKGQLRTAYVLPKQKDFAQPEGGGLVLLLRSGDVAFLPVANFERPLKKPRDHHSATLTSNTHTPLVSQVNLRSPIRSNRIKEISLAANKEVVSPHRSGVNSLQVDPAEGRFLLSGASDGTIAIFDMQTPSRHEGLTAKHEAILVTDRKNPQGHRFSVTSVCWYPVDTGLFVTASFDKHVKVWDSNAMSVEMDFKMSGKVYSIGMSAMTQSHCLIATGSEEPLVRLCDIASGSFTHTLEGHRDSVWAVQWSVSNEWVLLSGGCDGQIRCWDIRRAGCFMQLDQHRTLQGRRSGAKRARGSSDKLPSRLDGACRAAGSAIGPSVYSSSTAVGGGGRSGACGNTAAARVSNEVGRRFPSPAPPPPLQRSRHPPPLQQQQLAGNWSAGVGGRSVEAELQKRKMMASQIKSGHVGGGGKETVALCEGVGSSARRHVAHDAAITGLAPTADGLHLVSSGLDSRVRLWDLATGCNTLVNYAGTRSHSSMPTQIAVSPDSAFIYRPSGNAIQVFEMLTGKQHTVLHGHFDKVSCCTFHPAEQELYTGSADRQILVWGPPTKEVSDDDDPKGRGSSEQNEVTRREVEDEDAWSD